jgi:NDP-sugar pyrophosphorylase family protein
VVERSILWDGAIVEEGARVHGAIVVSGAVVRRDERARDVAVVPRRGLKGLEGVGEARGEMVWVGLT